MSKDVRFVDIDNSHDLGKVLSSKAAKDIMKYVVNHPKATATQIAKSCKLPLSTVQHHLKSLVQAQVLSDDIFSYSEKGRKVDHYTATEDIIVFVPTSKPKQQIMQSLKMLLPSALVVGGVGILGGLLSKPAGTTTKSYLANEYTTSQATTIAADGVQDLTRQVVVDEVAEVAAVSGTSDALQAAPLAADTASDVMLNTTTVIKEYVTQTVPKTTSLFAQPEFYLGVLGGIILLLLLLGLTLMIRKTIRQ